MNVLEQAIDMEMDGAQYYNEQATLNKDNSVGVVCLILAKAEESHAQILRSKADSMAYNLPDNGSCLKINNVFTNIGDFKSDIKITPSQLDFYRTALDLEKQSIDLYSTLLEQADEQNEKDLFQYLVEQENLHFTLLDTMVTMLRHAEDWVESAEFGLRNETY